MRSENRWVITGVFTAIGASLCCVTPILAILAGTGGLATNFSWLEPFRPWLISITLIILVFAWYQKLKKNTKKELECECEPDEKASLWQGKAFLWVVTMISLGMLLFPYYSAKLISESNLQTTFSGQRAELYEFDISGMTCSSCEAHVEQEITTLPGITSLDVSNEKGKAHVRFDLSLTNEDSIQFAIQRAGYIVISKQIINE